MSSYNIDLIQKLISKDRRNRRNMKIYLNDILLLSLIQGLEDLAIEAILITQIDLDSRLNFKDSFNIT